MTHWKKVTYSLVQLISFNKCFMTVPYKLWVSFSQRSLCGFWMLKPITSQHTALYPGLQQNTSVSGNLNGQCQTLFSLTRRNESPQLYINRLNAFLFDRNQNSKPLIKFW